MVQVGRTDSGAGAHHERGQNDEDVLARPQEVLAVLPSAVHVEHVVASAGVETLAALLQKSVGSCTLTSVVRVGVRGAENVVLVDKLGEGELLPASCGRHGDLATNVDVDVRLEESWEIGVSGMSGYCGMT